MTPEEYRRAWDNVELKDVPNGFVIALKCETCPCCVAGNGCCRRPRIVHRNVATPKRSGA